jgi:glycerophosphoryl diester phosphodiesterase
MPVHLYVDCKEIDTGEVIRILLQHRLLDSAVFYGSVKTLKEVRQFFPKARIMPPYPGAEKIDRMIKKLHPYALDVAFSDLSTETVSNCHAEGIKVFSDLLGKHDNMEAYKKATQLGIDVIQTDDVSGVLNFLNGFERQQK